MTAISRAPRHQPATGLLEGLLSDTSGERAGELRPEAVVKRFRDVAVRKSASPRHLPDKRREQLAKATARVDLVRLQRVSYWILACLTSLKVGYVYSDR
jgi:hypothetical protein